MLLTSSISTQILCRSTVPRVHVVRTLSSSSVSQSSNAFHRLYQCLFNAHICPCSAPKFIRSSNCEKFSRCKLLVLFRCHILSQSYHILKIQLYWFCVRKITTGMEERKHFLNGLQMQLSISWSFHLDKLLVTSVKNIAPIILQLDQNF